jgi:excisionase family DNA binding protein
MVMKRVLTIKEAVAITGLSDYAIRQGIRQGKLPACQLGGKRGRYLIDSEALFNAIQNLCIANIQREPDDPDEADYPAGNVVDFRTRIRRVQE